MTQTPPHVICRASTTKCGHQATNYILAGCLNQHIIEIALCGAHTHYNNIQLPPCPECRQQIEEAVTLDIRDITNTHLAEYVFHSRQSIRGSIILPTDCNHGD